MPQSQNGERDRNDSSQRSTQKETTGQGSANQQPQAQNTRRKNDGSSNWLAKTGLMSGLAVIGFVLLLFALGQAVGFDLLGLFAEAVSSQTGRWLVVALFALLLIGVAERGLRGTLRRV
ncbi:hypothetical protein [Haladaptatus caseinilyticus]|uniref:hypothetical protein n=1 Tax=Haladaptatus caseinilyticus TaxID=2993314 RepID=UPI00224B944E|nr:hypothetical protein [Haladaptatus caseinilyticus]